MVYLIFSVNKSGEFFGYARMDSYIDAGSIPVGSDISGGDTRGHCDLGSVKTTVTPKGAAPRGRIVVDSLHEAEFWEVTDDDEEKKQEYGARCGIPFQVEWIRT